MTADRLALLGHDEEDRTSSRAHLEENVAAATLHLSAGDYAQLTSA